MDIIKKQDKGALDAAGAEKETRKQAKSGASASTRKRTKAPNPEAAVPDGQSVETKDDFTLQYDVNSRERYVDSTSQKTEFDRMLDELSRISKDMLSWEVEKFTGKYQGEGDEAAAATARKFEAFLGGFITNAAMELYDRGYRDAAFQSLEQALKVLDAKRKLETEVESIKARNEEDSVDLSDMLGLFGGDDSGDGN